VSLARGKFGIEYDARRVSPEPFRFGWLVALVAFVALVSLTWSLVKRYRAHSGDASLMAVETVEPDLSLPDIVAEPEPEPAPAVEIATSQAFQAVQPLKTSLVNRPPKVRNLLMRLDEAEKRKDVEMAVTTIETIRALPGSPAADLDDALARKLGALNLCRLFELRNAQWVKQVKVKRGDSASRIAAENGSTLGSFSRLNGGRVDKVVIGRTVYVMNHPRFNLVLHRRSQTADLSLNGKFFKRYDLQGEVKARDGAYEMPEKRRLMWNGIGAPFKAADRVEIDQLVPTGASVLVSEM